MEEIRGEQHVVLQNNNVGMVLLLKSPLQRPAVVLREPRLARLVYPERRAGARVHPALECARAWRTQGTRPLLSKVDPRARALRENAAAERGAGSTEKDISRWQAGR